MSSLLGGTSTPPSPSPLSSCHLSATSPLCTKRRAGVADDYLFGSDALPMFGFDLTSDVFEIIGGLPKMQ